MTLEKSHGKARPSFVRRADARIGEAGDAAERRTAGRDANGKFAAGNSVGRGGRAKNAVGLGLATSVARSIFKATMATLPSDAPPVRGLAVIYATHLEQHGAFTRAAVEAGIASPEGRALVELADKQSARAERVLVTMNDLARQFAEREAKSRPAAWERALAALPKQPIEDDEEDDEQPETETKGDDDDDSE